MQKQIQQFFASAEKLISNPGIINESGKDFASLSALSESMPEADRFIGAVPLPSLLLLSIFQSRKSQNKQLINAMISQVLFYQPDQKILKVLRLIPTEELCELLFPFIYLEGSKGSAACYLSALLGLKIKPDSILHFLNSRNWLKTDIINLAMLISDSEVNAALAETNKAETAFPGSTNFSELVNEFRFILFNGKPIEPLMPDALPESKIKETNEDLLLKTISELNFSGEVKTPSPAVSSSRLIEKENQNVFSLLETLKKQITEKFDPQLILPLGIILITFFAMSRFSSNDIDISAPVTAKHQNNVSQWTDSISQQTITSKYMMADKDYRMGELYLTRDMFSEAEKMFEDALNSFPEHLEANYRSGYCKFFLKNFKGARTALEKVLKNDSSFKNANFLLARIAIENGETDKAEDYFNRELKVNQDPYIAMFFAEHLKKIGKNDEAGKLIQKFQTLYPDRIFPESERKSNGEKP